MKRGILLFVFTSILQLSFAQKDLERKLKQMHWDNAGPEFRQMKAPDRWKNESAVILATRIDYLGSFGRVRKSFTENIVIHYRVLLQDKASVREYSELTFNKNKITTNLIGKTNAYSFVAIKIVKPDGKEKEMDLTSAVKTDIGSEKDSKMAVPDLDQGDIIDFFIAIQSKDSEAPNITESDLLEEKYPVVYKQIRFVVPRQIRFNSKSFRGAPEFIKNQQGKDNIYTLIDTMRGRAPEILWDFPHRSSAEVRYKITNGKAVVHEDEALVARDALQNFDYNNQDIRYIEDFVHQISGKGKSQSAIVKEIYYLLRSPIFQKAYFNIEQGSPMDNHYVSERFFFLLNKYMKRYNIDHEIMIVPSRNYGPFCDLVNMSSCDLLLKVGKDSGFYLSRPTPFSIPGEIPYLFEGMEAVLAGYPKSITSSRINEQIPVSHKESNLTYSRYNLCFDSSDLFKVKVKRDVTAKGNNKAYHQYLIFTNHDYLREYDKPQYQSFSYSELKALVNEYSYLREKSEQQTDQENYERDRRVEVDIELELDTKISEYKNLTIKSAGMWEDMPDTEYSDEFIIDNATKKAGKNYILEVGKFIEKQTELSEEQLQRDRDIHMGFARTFNSEIMILIPEGYIVEGIDNLNINVSNAYGGFISAALLEQNKLVIKTSKYYTQNHCSAADWPYMVSFLNAAVKFSKSRILLKKL
ncbi:hypothetical protein MYP_2059 [Sporocytophaga myxococcoides]|uniref:DUF3857 domain-containing protein n=1 Tax=Sporocytophaga myxococcoides TaxID=153721 RepID=A0A098LD40_9BACT|nr:DUF3857 domain-containing protein [Sporocytophaga myxococcoides]GAL84831.1 hypothetical protein MYP_2059 [Sporocytophaga myxococcoides]